MAHGRIDSENADDIISGYASLNLSLSFGLYYSKRKNVGVFQKLMVKCSQNIYEETCLKTRKEIVL